MEGMKMARIKITAGVFGWNRGQTYELVKAGDPPIEVEDALATRLVGNGVAEYVTPPVKEETPDLPDLPDGVVGIPEYSTRNTVKELQEIAALCGITFEEGMTKAQMVEALDQHIADNLVEGDEAAPTFDAAEAVQ
jgi:hypothetical protein